MHSETMDRKRDHLTITEMSRSYGVSLRTLRFYEQQGLLNPRRDGLQRLYSHSDRLRVESILTGKRLGFTLREIDDLLRSYQSEAGTAGLVDTLEPGKIQKQIAALESQKADIETALNELTMALELKA